MEQDRPRPIALVFAGGNALGAYQAGAFAAFDRAGRKPFWLAGSSVGAVNAAIIAGNKPENRVSALREYWRRASLPDGPWDVPIPGWSRSLHLASSVQTRLLGRPAIFSPRLSLPGSAQNPEQASLYNFTPLRRTLGELIDFERVNGGDIRMSIMTVDIETGEEVVFDTSRECILLDHVLASAGLIPDFPAREIGGRWLGDGALSANARSALSSRSRRMV